MNLTLSGVPAALAVVPGLNAVTGSVAAGFVIGGAGAGAVPEPFFVDAVDANGNTLVGPYAPVFTVKSLRTDFNIAQPSDATPDQFTVTPPNVISAQTTLKVRAKPAPSCNAPDAVCSTGFFLHYRPYQDDDWLTFAHDFKRTGLQQKTSGFSASNVTQATVRWKTTVEYYLDASVLAYKGNVIVSSSHGIVYDLSAANGAQLWQTNVGGSILGTPTIDAADGLVLVANRLTAQNQPAPSYLFALSLSTGKAVWQVQLPGPIRAAPVVANHIVYEGWAGGDHPGCINGGVSAINATTGTIEWTWLTNPQTNPEGGGGVWGGLAYDGDHIFVGTGNTCTLVVPGQQGEVALNLDGSLDWGFTADSNLSDDDDTGGATMLKPLGGGRGAAFFMNKDGSLYSLSQQTGAQLSAVPLGAALGYGAYASPTTDGSNVFVGAGYIPIPSVSKPNRVNSGSDASPGNDWFRRQLKDKPQEILPGYMSYLRAVDSQGNVIWSQPMTSTIINYVAVNNGLVFAGMDTNLDVIGAESGSILWSYAAGSDFQAGPAVVPSGVYAADLNGDVFALSIPASAYQ